VVAARSQGRDEKGLGATLRAAPEFVAQVRTETGKVAWPTRRETLTTAVMVVLMTFILGLFFFGVDAAFNALAKLLLGLVS
jgi:preprotein translocase subunit SecE